MSAIEIAATEAGLEFMYLPLTHQNMTPDVIAQNHGLISSSEGPVVAYCASGTRSTIAWALAAVTEMSVDEVIQAAYAGGYDLSNLRPTLDAAARG